MAKHKTIVFTPFTRVEGNLRLRVEVADGAVVSARASGTLFRGFEEMVRGQQPTTAIVILCRICGQCGAAHSSASAEAIGNAFAASPPPNGVQARSIIQAVETVLSHLGHFYFSLGADLCALPGGAGLEEAYAPVRGTSFQKALRARRVLLGLMGLFAGKWPNTLAIQPGGVTRAVSRSEIIRAKGILAEFSRFLEQELLHGPIERWLANRSMADVERWLGEADHQDSDLGRFIVLALQAGLQRIGRGPGRFLSSGGFSLPSGKTWLQPGYYEGGVHPFDPSKLVEDVAFSWFEEEGAARHPSEGSAVPSHDKPQGYSWAKAPRYVGQSVEVGPMARMVVDGDPLATNLMSLHGPSVFARVLLRLHEAVRLVKNMEAWLGQINPEAPYCVKHQARTPAAGSALVEAPRGLLGHWIQIEHERVRNYQIITPTGFNLSPRDREGQPGPLEEALVGTPVEDPDNAVNIALVVRSYDPCLYCSVH